VRTGSRESQLFNDLPTARNQRGDSLATAFLLSLSCTQRARMRFPWISYGFISAQSANKPRAYERVDSLSCSFSWRSSPEPSAEGLCLLDVGAMLKPDHTYPSQRSWSFRILLCFTTNTPKRTHRGPWNQRRYKQDKKIRQGAD
jgi:hypothetical protein